MVGKLVNTLIVFRIIKMLTTPWEKTDAYKLGLITKDGKRTDVDLTTTEQQGAMNLLTKLVFNLKRVIEKVPFGKSKFASYAVAIALLKEHTDMTADQAEELCEKVYSHGKEMGVIDPVQELTESEAVMTLTKGRAYNLRRQLHEQNDTVYPQKAQVLVLAEHSIVFGVHLYVGQIDLQRVLVTEDDVY